MSNSFILSPYYEKKIQEVEKKFTRNYNNEKKIQENLIINRDYNLNKFLLAKESKKPINVQKVNRERKKRELLKTNFNLPKTNKNNIRRKPTPSINQEMHLNKNLNNTLQSYFILLKEKDIPPPPTNFILLEEEKDILLPQSNFILLDEEKAPSSNFIIL